MNAPDGSPDWSPDCSLGSLLGGQVAYRQQCHGYRTGIEPVLLAASIPARPGEHVVEAGTGAGAGLLCLAARVPGIAGLGLEIDPSLARLAQANFEANGHTTLQAVAQDLGCWSAPASYDHAFANPPWHADDSTASPNPATRTAKSAACDLLANWIHRLAASLRRRGTLSLILPSACIADAMATLVQANCAEVTLIPLWPRAGQAAKLAIVRGVREGKGPTRIAPGLVLHEEDGAYAASAERILRHSGALA